MVGVCGSRLEDEREREREEKSAWIRRKGTCSFTRIYFSSWFPSRDSCEAKKWVAHYHRELQQADATYAVTVARRMREAVDLAPSWPLDDDALS